MRASLALAWVWLIAMPVHAANQKRAEHRAEAMHLSEALCAGENVEANLARVRYIAEEDSVSIELMKTLMQAPDDHRRETLSFALGALGARVAEPALVRLSQDSDPVVRMNAVQGLGRIPTRDWRALVPLLKDSSMGVRAESAKALGALKSPRAAKALVAAARIEGEPEVRAAMLTAAGESGDKSVAPALTGYLTSSSEATRLGAARGLCHLGAPAGFAFAKKLLDSKEKYERRGGLELFEGASAKVAGPLLRPLLKDADVALAAKAARILYQGGEPVMLDWLVLASFHGKPDEKEAYERELELLHLQDDQRRAILAKAGIQ